MTLYEALEQRATGLARLTDEVAPVAHLIRQTAIGAARWSEKSRADIATATIETYSNDDGFVLRLSPGPVAVVPLYRSIIVNTFETAATFVRANPRAVDVLQSLSSWALRQIARGATRFEARWSPGSEGFLAITAVVPAVKAS